MTKDKCRELTRKIVNGDIADVVLPGSFFVCNNCLTIEDLTLHHEVYPDTITKIILAINRRKIYMLCKKCHVLLHKEELTNKQKTNNEDIKYEEELNGSL